MTGGANLVLSWLFGILLALMFMGFWTMRQIRCFRSRTFSLPWVVLNTILFAMKNRPVVRRLRSVCDSSDRTRGHWHH